MPYYMYIVWIHKSGISLFLCIICVEIVFKTGLAIDVLLDHTLLCLDKFSELLVFSQNNKTAFHSYLLHVCGHCKVVLF